MFDFILSNFIKKAETEIQNLDELIDILKLAHRKNLIDSEALMMLESILSVRDIPVRDIMIPRSHMDVIDIHDSPEKFMPFLIEAGHSRFPVVEESKDNIIGILLAKDLLQYMQHPEDFNMRDILRPATFIPESKRLNVLLKEFRMNRNHLAIVVDEYGGVAGLVTIEDVLEEIVGEIEDEYDFDEDEDNIIKDSESFYRVKGVATLDEFNHDLKVHYESEDFDTIGGLVINHFGRVPKRGEILRLDNIQIEVIKADSRRVYLLHVQKV